MKLISGKTTPRNEIRTVKHKTTLKTGVIVLGKPEHVSKMRHKNQQSKCYIGRNEDKLQFIARMH